MKSKLPSPHSSPAQGFGPCDLPDHCTGPECRAQPPGQQATPPGLWGLHCRTLLLPPRGKGGVREETLPALLTSLGLHFLTGLLWAWNKSLFFFSFQSVSYKFNFYSSWKTLRVEKKLPLPSPTWYFKFIKIYNTTLRLMIPRGEVDWGTEKWVKGDSFMVMDGN